MPIVGRAIRGDAAGQRRAVGRETRYKTWPEGFRQLFGTPAIEVPGQTKGEVVRCREYSVLCYRLF